MVHTVLTVITDSLRVASNLSGAVLATLSSSSLMDLRTSIIFSWTHTVVTQGTVTYTGFLWEREHFTPSPENGLELASINS